MNVLSKLIRVPADVLKAYVCSALVLSIVAAAELTASNIYQSQRERPFHECHVREVKISPETGEAVFLMAELVDSREESLLHHHVGWINLSDGQPSRASRTYIDNVRCIQLANDGQSILLAVGEGDLARLHCSPKTCIHTDMQVFCKGVNRIFSRDGQGIVYLDGDMLAAMDGDTQQVLWRRSFDSFGVFCPTKDFSACYFASNAGELLQLNCENGEIINRSKISKIGIGRAVVDHAGEKIAITQLNGRIAVVSLKDMSPLWNSETTLSFSPVFSNDGRYLVNFIGDENSTIDILHADTGKIRMKLDKRRGLIGATFSNDDRILYTWGMQGTIQAWDVEGGKLIWERLLTTCISRNT